jgi:hypothetical protein
MSVGAMQQHSSSSRRKQNMLLVYSPANPAIDDALSAVGSYANSLAAGMWGSLASSPSLLQQRPNLQQDRHNWHFAHVLDGFPGASSNKCEL